MKKKLFFLLILILLFGGFVVVRYFILRGESQEGQLKIIASPNASVFLDNVAAGKTPFESTQSVGEHLVKLIPQGVATDTASWQGKVKVNKNALTFVERELGESDLTSAGVVFTIEKLEKGLNSKDNGAVEVETEPTGSIVYLDDDEKGIAPLILTDVIPGDHELSVYSPGFFRRTQKINVEPGYKVIAKFKLAIDPSQKDVDSLDEEKEATKSAKTKKTVLKIKETPTGWLRVRSEPSLSASEAARVNPGDTFDLIEEKEGWYKIEYEPGKEGWVSSNYSEKGAAENQEST